MRPHLTLALLLLLGAVTPAVADTGFYELDGVEYYMAVGIAGSGAFSLGPDYVANTTQPLDGCVVAKLRPDMDRGRVQLITNIFDVPFRVEVVEFHDVPQMPQGAVAVGVPVDGSRTHGLPQHPEVQTQIAAWGEGLIEVDGVSYTDPSTDRAAFNVTFYVTDGGYRDDDTQQVLDDTGALYMQGQRANGVPGDREVHLRIESWGNATGGPHTEEASVPGPGDNQLYHMPADDYREVHRFYNSRFGANGTVTIQASNAAPGMETDMQFTIRSPNGDILDVFDWQQDITPIGFGASHTSTFPLDRFGAYAVEVTGSNDNPFNYDITFRQDPAPPLDLNLWWEEAALGSYGPEAQAVCEEAISLGSEPVTQAIFPRPDPPAFPVQTVILTTLGIIAALLVLTKMGMMMRAARHPSTSSSRSKED